MPKIRVFGDCNEAEIALDLNEDNTPGLGQMGTDWDDKTATVEVPINSRELGNIVFQIPSPTTADLVLALQQNGIKLDPRGAKELIEDLKAERDRINKIYSRVIADVERVKLKANTSANKKTER